MLNPLKEALDFPLKNSSLSLLLNKTVVSTGTFPNREVRSKPNFSLYPAMSFCCSGVKTGMSASGVTTIFTPSSAAFIRGSDVFPMVILSVFGTESACFALDITFTVASFCFALKCKTLWSKCTMSPSLPSKVSSMVSSLVGAKAINTLSVTPSVSSSAIKALPTTERAMPFDICTSSSLLFLQADAKMKITISEKIVLMNFISIIC